MIYHHIRLINIKAEHAQDDRFKEKFRLLQEQLNAPGRIDHTCLHEATHLVYFRRAKIQADKYGPTIEYLEDIKDFISCLAAIGTPTINEFTIYTPKLLDDLARAGIAANLFDDEFLKELDKNSPLANVVFAEKSNLFATMITQNSRGAASGL